MINGQIGEATNQIIADNKSNTHSNIDDKQFSFKNISNKNKNKDNERDTINDMLNSPNSSRKSDFKHTEIRPNYEKFVNAGFSNIQKFKNQSEKNEEYERVSVVKSLASFGENLNLKAKQSSPKKVQYTPMEPSSNSRFLKSLMDEGPNHSMLGVIDDSSNKIEPNFMFLNDKNSNRYHDRNASMMFDNHHSNTLFGLAGTPNKYEISQNNIFEQHPTHSNISALFPPIQVESNTFQKKLFKQENDIEVDNQKQKPETPKKSPITKEVLEIPNVLPAVQPFMHHRPVIHRQQKLQFAAQENKIHHDFISYPEINEESKMQDTNNEQGD